jgi:hypothetical protein
MSARKFKIRISVVHFPSANMGFPEIKIETVGPMKSWRTPSFISERIDVVVSK